ncbi:MAG: 3'-5' exonuclease [Fusobacteriaceae bacterium]
MNNIKLTEEQIDIINCNESVIVVNSVAGASKSTTSFKFAQARPNDRILYIVFGKAMAQEATHMFKELSNVYVKTTHSLAYKHFGFKYKDKLSMDVKLADIVLELKLKKDYATANIVMDIFNKFLASMDSNIEAFAEEEISTMLTPHYKAHILKLCKILWDRSIDLKDHIKVSHDFYLKLFQLSGYNLGSEYSIIILDECHDSNMCVFDITNRATVNQKLILGDRSQSIYEFRHCQNIMDYFTDTTQKTLSVSFRVNQDVANMSNLIVDLFANRNMKMKGANSSQVVYSGRGLNLNNYTDNLVVIARTNATLISNAIEATQRGKWIHFCGGIKSYPIQWYKDLFFFRITGKSFNPKLSNFSSWKELTQHAEDVEDCELITGIKFINQYSKKYENFPAVLDKISEYNVAQKDAQYIYVTAHKSKGLTFTTPVLIEEDFPNLSTWAQQIDIYKDEDNEKALSSFHAGIKQEVHLLYVAITRAKGTLYLNRKLSDFFGR